MNIRLRENIKPKEEQHVEKYTNNQETIQNCDQKIIDGISMEVIRQNTLLPEIEKEIDIEMLSAQESYQRRALYSKLEQLYLDFCEIPIIEIYIDQINKYTNTNNVLNLQKLKSTYISKLIEPKINNFIRLREKMTIRLVPISFFLRLFWTLSGTIFTITSMPILYILTCTRLLHPQLRWQSVPLKYQPQYMIQRQYSRSTLAYFGCYTAWEYNESIDYDKTYISLFTHQSSLDSWITSCGRLNHRLIGKKILFFIPFLGWQMYLWGHLPISRNNLKDAKNTFKIALQHIKISRCCIGLFPEGRRSPIGRPIELKKGSFHLAIQSKLPIIPTIIIGTGELWPYNSFFTSPGIVYVRTLEPIYIQSDDTYITLMKKTRRAILEGYSEPIQYEKLQYANLFIDYLFFPFAYFILYIVLRAIGL